MSELQMLLEEATNLCDENYPIICLRANVTGPAPGYRCLPGWTATIIAYKYPNDARGSLTYSNGKTFEGEWFVLRGKATPKEDCGEDEQFVSSRDVHGTSHDTPEAALRVALDKLKAKIAAGEWPRHQKRLLPVTTVAELLSRGTVGLQTGDLAWVTELDGVPPKDPSKPRTHWGPCLVFMRTRGREDDDTIFAAPSGGFWCRVRDVP